MLRNRCEQIRKKYLQKLGNINIYLGAKALLSVKIEPEKFEVSCDARIVMTRNDAPSWDPLGKIHVRLGKDFGFLPWKYVPSIFLILKALLDVYVF